VKTLLVGAKTVKGPSPECAFTRPVTVRAATKVEKSSFPVAISTMVPSQCIAIIFLLAQMHVSNGTSHILHTQNESNETNAVRML